MTTNHPIIAGHIEAFDKPGLGLGPLEPDTRICDADSGASAEVTASECDDSPQMVHDGLACEPGLNPTSGPLATSSQGDLSDDLAPLVTIDDLELEELRWRRGDWRGERDLQMYEASVTRRMFA